MSNTDFSAEEFNALGECALWPRFLLFPTIAVVGNVAFAAGLAGDSLVIKLMWSICLGYCWFCVAGSFHESVHQSMGRWRNANIWYGKVVGTFLGIPYSAYRETHIRHHAYLNTADDFELWPYSKPGTSLAFRRAFVVFDVLGAVLANPVVYGRIYFVPNSPLSAQARSAIGREYIAIAVFWGSIIVTLVGLTQAQLLDWGKFDPIWLLPLPIAAGMNGFRKFTEHLGMTSTDPILGTRTVIGKSWITRMCSYFNFDLDIHGPHHRFPKVPHFELESRLAEYRSKHPDMAVPLFSSYLAAVWDTLPHLWRNPAVGENAGGQNQALLPPGIENFVSEVIQPIDLSSERAA